MSDGMNRTELLAEIRRLHRLLAIAGRKAAAQFTVADKLTDKLTAANLHVQKLMKKLEERKR